MRLDEMLVGVLLEGDPEAETLVTELLGAVKLKDLTEDQLDILLKIKARWIDSQY